MIVFIKRLVPPARLLRMRELSSDSETEAENRRKTETAFSPSALAAPLIRGAEGNVFINLNRGS